MQKTLAKALEGVAPILPAAVVLGLAHVASARAVLPALGLFTGPLGAVLLGVAVALALWRLIDPGPLPLPGRWLSFNVSLLVAVTIGLGYVRSVEPSGDEIDYLLMAQSVWREGDLDLRDNFARGDHLEYLGGHDRMPGGFRVRGGRYYPTHSGGLAVLLAPAYALGGRAGCVVLLALLAAGLGLLVRGMAARLTGDEGAALAAWAAVVGPPVLFYTAFLYSEVVVAFCLAVALRAILWPRGPARAVLAALALAALPWLHVRMSLAAATIGVFAVVRLRGRARIAFLAAATAMAGAWAVYHLAAFGTLSPLVRYGGGLPGPMQNPTPLRTLVGLFVDGAYGLLPYAPLFLLALAGLPLLVSRRGAGQRRAADASPSSGAPSPAALGWAVVAAGLGVLLPVLSWRNWWGFSPPARFTIPLVPVLGLALALRLAVHPGRGLARWRWPLAGLGLALAVFLFAEPRTMLMVNGRYGTAHGFDALAGDVSLSRYLPFPSSRLGSTAPPWEPPASEARVAAVWVVALLALLVLDRLAWTRDRVDRWFRGLTLPLALLFAVSVVVERWARP